MRKILRHPHLICQLMVRKPEWCWCWRVCPAALSERSSTLSTTRTTSFLRIIATPFRCCGSLFPAMYDVFCHAALTCARPSHLADPLSSLWEKIWCPSQTTKSALRRVSPSSESLKITSSKLEAARSNYNYNFSVHAIFSLTQSSSKNNAQSSNLQIGIIKMQKTSPSRNPGRNYSIYGRSRSAERRQPR